VAVSQEREQHLAARNQPVPPAITGLALLDTGASSTCVDEAVAQQLGIAAVDVVTISSASHAAAQKLVHPIRLRVLGTEIVINASRAIGVPLQPQGFIALLGRDFLERFVLICNGPAGEMTLGF
jgi:predicted aspartyl protease